MVTKWELVGKVSSSVYRTKVVKLLGQGPNTPTSMAKLAGINTTHLSRTLRELEGFRLVECLTPSLRKGRIFALTGLGKVVFAFLTKRL